jgi:hypothetical protein
VTSGQFDELAELGPVIAQSTTPRDSDWCTSENDSGTGVPPVDRVEVRLVDLARDLVVGRGADEIESEQGRLVARVLRHAQRHDVEQPCLHDAQLLGVLDAERIDRFVIGVDRQVGALGELVEERLLLVLLDQAGGRRLADHLERDAVLRDGGCGGHGDGDGGQRTAECGFRHGTAPSRAKLRSGKKNMGSRAPPCLQ